MVRPMGSVKLGEVAFEPAAHLAAFQELLSLPRETVPRTTLAAAQRVLAWGSEALGLELVSNEGNTPTFLLLPKADSPDVLLFAAWHAEIFPAAPAALEGGERLALGAMLGALAALGGAGVGLRAAVVVAPGATLGSRVLEETLGRERARLAAPVAFWVRIAPRAPRRRRVFLGARGRVVLGVWGEGANPYRIRDILITELTDQVYGPRPLDFELLGKLAENAAAVDFLEETLEDPNSVAGEGKERFRSALFDPRGHVLAPQVRHTDRPQAWIVIETAENMDPSAIHRRAQELADGCRIELAEGFRWDRLNIHHPSIQTEIQLAKSRSEGAEIWPMAPWVTPSGLFTRALGTPLAEWAVALPPGTALRSPSAESLTALEQEIGELLLRATGSMVPADVP